MKSGGRNTQRNMSNFAVIVCLDVKFSVPVWLKCEVTSNFMQLSVVDSNKAKMKWQVIRDLRHVITCQRCEFEKNQSQLKKQSLTRPKITDCLCERTVLPLAFAP